MRFTKHILPLFLALAMLTTALAGCDNGADTETEVATATATATETEIEVATETETEVATATATATETEIVTETETPTETDTEAETTVEAEDAFYTLTFTSNGDGTCYVSHVDFRENAGDREITLEFPEKSPEGDTVTAIRYTTGDNLPRIISDEDFRHHIIAPLLEQMGVRPRLEELGLIQPGQDLAELDFETVPDDIFNTDNMAFPFRFRMLISWYGGQYGKKSLAGQVTDSLKQALISNYPFLKEDPDAEFWTLDSSISPINLVRQGEMMSLISYAPADAARDEGTWHDAHRETVNYCKNIVAMKFPDTLTDLDSAIFCNCTSMRTVQIPEQVTELCDYAFAGYLQLTSLEIPSSVTSIRNSVFYNCTNLTNITVPDSVTYIGNKSFENTPWFNALCEDESNWTDDMLYIGHCLVDCKTDKVGTASLKEGTTCIAGNAFNGCSKVTSVELPGSMTSIGDYAFCSCYGLTSITIPDGVTKIGDYAFSNCAHLTNVTIPSGVADIGYGAFNDTAWYSAYDANESNWADGLLYMGPTLVKCDCEKAGIVSIREGTTRINDKAFQLCCNLTNIKIPDSVTHIGESAFDGCNSLTSVELPNSVISIGRSAFFGCSGLTSITVAEGNPAYHSNGNCLIETASKTLIAGCQNSVIPNDGSVTSIDGGAFSGCSGLTSITIPDSVTSIGDGAFEDCTGLTSITIPDSVTSIGNLAFSRCTSLTKIEIPASVTSVGGQAFIDCFNLTSITVADKNPVYHSDGNCLIETKSKTLIQGCNSSIIPADDSVTSIGDSAFWGCTGLTSVIIPDSVTSVGGQAFVDCFNLTSVTIPDSVTKIDSFAFLGCTGLTSITIPDSVTYIDGGAFYNCTGLTDINFTGTIEQWNAISKGGGWNSNTASYTIHCTDGDISK